MEFKLNIGCPKTKKCIKKELKDTDCKPLIGKKINDVLKGEAIDFPGYEFKVTGGSDSSGFPMRWDVDSTPRKKILIASGVGIKKKKRKGIRLRKTVAGNFIHEKTAQINLKIMKYGPQPLETPAEKLNKSDDSLTPQEPKAEEAPKKEEKKKEKKEEPKVKEKKPEVKKEKPKEAPKKENPKAEDKKEAPKKEKPKEEKKGETK